MKKSAVLLLVATILLGSAALSNPLAPAHQSIEFKGSYFPIHLTDMVISGNLGYCASNAGLCVYDISNPLQSRVVASVACRDGQGEGIALSGSLAYLADSNFLVVFDVSDPGSPTILTSRRLVAHDVETRGDSVYVAGDTFRVLIPTSYGIPAQIASAPVSGTALKLIGNRAYVFGDSGLTILDITDSKSPTILGTFSTVGRVRDFEVVNNLLYAMLGSNQFTVIDVSDPASVQMVSQTRFQGSNGEDYTSGVAVVGDIAYAEEFVLNISDPVHPRRTCGTVGTAENILVKDGRIFYPSNVYGLIEYRPVQVDSTEPVCIQPNYSQIRIQIIDSIAYVAGHQIGRQHWQEGTFLETIDLHDLNSPRLLGFVSDSFPAAALSHNIQNGYDYLLTSKKLKIFDVSDPTNLRLVSDYAGFNGDYMSMAMRYPFVYLGKSSGYLDVVDISDPVHPTSLAPFGIGLPLHEDPITHIDLIGNRARLLGLAAISEVDISDPINQPLISRTVSQPVHAIDMVFKEDLVFTATNLGLEIFQISPQDAITRIGYYDISSYYDYSWRHRNGPTAITLQYPNVYLAENHQIFVFNVADSRNPALIDRIKWPSATQPNFLAVATAPGLLATIHSDAHLVALSVSGCCQGTTGDIDNSGIVDLADLSHLVAYLTAGIGIPSCPEAANINGQGIVDLADLAVLVAYLTTSAHALPSCP